MPHSLFISDLHLCPTRPQTTQLFLNFLENTVPGADSLYILGDLFEYWAGDDDLPDPFNQSIAHAISRLSSQSTAVFLMHGNRDLLMAQAMEHACHASLLEDPVLIDLHGTPTLLSHGDILCTDDHEYQAFRAKVRVPAWQADFLAQPLTVRKAFIENLRKNSQAEKQLKASAIMDVNQDAVLAMLARYGNPPRLIHGHTHRPACHKVHVGDQTSERWVLPAWEESGGYLRCNKDGCQALPISA